MEACFHNRKYKLKKVIATFSQNSHFPAILENLANLWDINATKFICPNSYFTSHNCFLLVLRFYLAIYFSTTE